MLEDQPVFASARLALVAIAQHILRHRRLLGHERPLHPGRESGATAPAQSGILDLINNGVRFHRERLLHGLVAVQFEVPVNIRRAQSKAPGYDLYLVGM